MLHDYQKAALDWVLEKPYCGLFLEMGLGKTLIALTALDRLLNDYFCVEKILVVAPLRVATDTWPAEAAKWPHLKDLRLSIVAGQPTAEHRKRALRRPADIYVINRENIDWLVSYMGKNWDFDCVVIDELSSFKNQASRRFTQLRRVRPKIKRLIGLTGTPAPNGLIDLWAQIYLLDQGDRLGTGIVDYRSRYFRAEGQEHGMVYVPWKESKSRIYQAIQDIVISMNSADYLDLPPLTETVRKVRLDGNARKLYDSMERDLLLPYVDDADAEVTALTAAALSTKLLQMASGAVYDDERGIRMIHDSKLDALEDVIEAANGKPVMVFYNYIHSFDRLKARFPSARALGKGKAGSQDIADWNADRIPILLLHPKSAGHGLNLQESSCQSLVWYDQSWSLEENLQAVARAYRQGQKRPVVVTRLIADDTIDEKVFDAISRKAYGQAALMDAVKARIRGLTCGKN